MSISNLFFIDSTGINYPDYPTLLAQIQSQLRDIFGNDINLDADSQDGESTAIITSAIYDTMQVAVMTYNAYSSQFALSDALDRNVKINGIKRHSGNFSQVNLTIIGGAGTTIINGIAQDILGQKWLLPAIVTIPITGDIVATAFAQVEGDIRSAAGTITKIATPTNGWQSVNNVLDSIPGNNVESDAHLRARQTISTMIPNLTVLDGIAGGLASLDSVKRVKVYQNDTNVTDSLGLPPHSISCVVDGGDTQQIGDTIAQKKSPGVSTYGDIPVTTTDSRGVITIVNFFEPELVEIDVQVNITALPGFLASTTTSIQNAVAAYINGLDIGESVYNSKLCAPANLYNDLEGTTYNSTSILARIPPNPFSTADILLSFKQSATCDPANVQVIVT
jgi:uncharacterized phage protein gp47/JayE